MSKDMKNRAIVEQLNLLSKMQKYCCPFELNFYLLIGLNLELLVWTPNQIKVLSSVLPKNTTS